MRRAFTLIEMVIATAVMAVVMAIAGLVFRAGVQAVRLSAANAEIMDTFRVITGQLDADFQGLAKDGEIFVVWSTDPNGQERFDRIMFHSLGDFSSYDEETLTRSNLARITYALAADGSASNLKPPAQAAPLRMLARTQHVYIAGTPEPNDFDPTEVIESDELARQWHNRQRVDYLTLKRWNDIPEPNKNDLLSVIGDVNVADSSIPPSHRGVWIDRGDPNTLHLLLAERVGQFSIQGLRRIDGRLRRWPAADPDGDGTLEDSDFPRVAGITDATIDGDRPLWRLYAETFRRTDEDPQGMDPNDRMGSPSAGFESWDLGPDLLFTVTLYDSQGLIKGGRTLTHRIPIR